MELAADLRGIYADYLHEVEALLAQAKPGDGLLGMGNAPQHAPCHEQFDQQVERLVQAQGGTLAPSDAVEVVELLLRGEKDASAPDCAAWMLIAVQRHSMALIPRLSREEAQRLLAWYTQAYPACQRLPIQKEIIRLLKRQAR